MSSPSSSSTLPSPPSGPPIKNARLTPELTQPYIEAGLISQSDIDTFAKGFKRTMTYSTIGFCIGSLAPAPLIFTKLKTTFLQRLLIGTAGGVGGAVTATSLGAWRMHQDLKAAGTPNIGQRLMVYQGLILHQTDPIKFPPPPLDLSMPNRNPQQGLGTGNKPFPMPKYDDRVDSQGRPFPQPPHIQNEPSKPFSQTRSEFESDSDDTPDLREFDREKEREKALGIIGGGRLGMDDGADYGSFDRATKENPTSWALLRSRSSPGTSSSLPTPLSTSSAPVSAEFSTSSLPPPTIPSSSLDTFSTASSSRDRPMTDREREQAEFDRIVERERHAVDTGFSSASPSTGSSWGELREGSQSANAGASRGESVW
ncbi:hypothetical protein [Phaffia rhodozyma]|uniref:Uncharacterized protein n=1 Tax=Phaffia rhodozyma TaxID=264483 RepID=A0A0F7SY81_PHARH|nr:hypothetical protein [Phaffia rhodozyma]